MVFGGRLSNQANTPTVEFYDWSQQPTSSWVQGPSIPWVANAIVASIFRVYNETFCEGVLIS